jgi:DNA replication protein DnaC
MGRLITDFEAALPHLSKAVFSQPIDKTDYGKVAIRPVLLRGEVRYQLERFRDNKAYHQNATGDHLLKILENELEGRYRQGLVVTDTETIQYSMKANGSYKRHASASVPLPVGIKSHNREKEYILKEGENIPALVDLGVFTKDFKVVRSRYDKYKQINRFVELVAQGFAGEKRDEISILDFGCGKSYLTFILYYYFAVKLGVKTRIIVTHNPFSQQHPAPFDIEEDIYREWCRILREQIKPDLMLFAHTHEYGIHPVGSEWDHLGQPCPAVIGAEPRKDRFIGCGLIIGDDKISVVFTDSNGQTFGHSSIYR